MTEIRGIVEEVEFEDEGGDCVGGECGSGDEDAVARCVAH